MKRPRKFTLSFCAATFGLLAAQFTDAATWTSTSPLNLARHSHTATLLPNGQLLIAGGAVNTQGITNGAEIYDPATGTSKATGLMNVPRLDHTATLLLNGKVLVAGGLTNASSTATNAEFYDPAAGTWSVTGPMGVSRSFHTATLLRNGNVLV